MSWQYILNPQGELYPWRLPPGSGTGEPGPTGPAGPQGPATVTVGSAVVSPPGFAYVTNSGTDQNVVLNFGIPQGIQGNAGVNGTNGTAATVAVGAVTTLAPGTPATVVNVGTPYQALFDFAIPSGYDGDSATVQVGTTTTLAPGSPATVSNSGGDTNAVFNFGIPAGVAASVDAGITTTLPAGSPAVVSNSGTTSAAVFDFFIPQGPAGAVGATGATGATGPAGSGFDVEGLQNKLGIFPALPYTSDTIALAADNTGIPATEIVPDATPPTASTTPDGTPCWLYTKPSPSNAGFNWFMYNPRFGNPAATLPYRKYSNSFKDRIQSVWALVQPAVNTNIYTAGVVALNLYSYDDANPPATGFYNTRWAYSNTQGLNSGQSGVNLYAGYTYLLYAYDAPRINNLSSVGVPDVQDWGLRDPYDIYPDVNHIPLQNCVLAFQQWADGTNYLTWNSSTNFLTGQVCIFSGFGLGGTGNGIFYTAVANNNNQPPLSVTGIPNLTHWVPLSPQPTSYAQQPISSMNITGINGTTTGWTAGPLLRVLSMGYTTGPNPLTRTSSVRVVLN